MAIINSDGPGELEERDFSLSRKGYDRDEVNTYLRKVDAQFRDLSLRSQDSKVRLEQAACHRLLKEFRESADVLRQLLNASPPESIRWLADAEAIRLQLAAGRAPQRLRSRTNVT